MDDELVKVLRKTDFSDGCPCGAAPLCKDKDCVILQAADAIEELTDNHVGKWIPVTERLPEQGKRYLVIRFDKVTKTKFIDILWHDAHDLWWNRLYKGQYNVTHWMPLPEPPKEEAT
jgi:hypothetical protein